MGKNYQTMETKRRVVVVVRPANAVKELIENSLDAGATEIIVTIKDGGLSLLQVQDNGKGIHKDDLDIVCERFTTSKLSRFEDLQSMKTYGFRGEALSSISHVAKVTITSKPAGQHCAFQAKYIDGKAESVKASAGLEGTCVTAEDLFYNCQNRKKSFRNYADEANRVVDVVMRYAVHRPDISFTMRRGGTGADFRTSGHCSRDEIIRSLLGKDCGEKHKLFFVFINGRLVQCQTLKFAVDSVFNDRDLICSFAMISLMIDPFRVDVNIHPTKQSVVFLEEEAIVEDLQKYIFSKLVRVDRKERRLDEFISSTKSAQSSSSVEIVEVVGSQFEDSVQNAQEGKGRRVFQFESLNNLRRKICGSASQPLRELFKSLTFIGCVSPSAMLLQFGTGLYIIRLQNVLKELFYQTLIFSFGNFGSFKLASGANVLELLQMAGLESEQEFNALELLEAQAAMLNDYFSLQIVRADDTERSVEGLRKLTLLTLPSIIDGYTPQMEGLPTLMMSLVNDVNWEEVSSLQLTSFSLSSLSLNCGFFFSQEEACFDGVSQAIAEFFVIKEEYCDGDALSGLEGGEAPWLAVIRDVCIPRVKSHLVPPDTLRECTTRLADLHDLYKVFERC
ncbi:DNA mismatch repair protein [Necator americanus]|uniref:DNA mismatch repair protein n=1 Tax=Necator americanus TaxID=51031 RepID=W2TBR9_NECAM|nr:DNA mismatch repair protein [Necator americanus]ETN78447.1 DNA mismatch repair protein [Necator americanus]